MINFMTSVRSFFVNQEKLSIVAMLGLFAFFASSAAFATAGGSDLDNAFQTVWTDLIAVAEGYGGRIMMILMVFAGIYFAIGSPNFIAFAACVCCILVLANISNILETALGASYQALPNISDALTVLNL